MQGTVVKTAQRLAERHIHKAVSGALPGIETDVKAYLAETAEQGGLDAAASVASLDLSDIIGVLLDNTAVQQTQNGLTVDVDTRAVVETLESIAAILAEKNIINMDDVIDDFSNNINEGDIINIVKHNIKSRFTSVTQP